MEVMYGFPYRYFDKRQVFTGYGKSSATATYENPLFACTAGFSFTILISFSFTVFFLNQSKNFPKALFRRPSLHKVILRMFFLISGLRTL